MSFAKPILMADEMLEGPLRDELMQVRAENILLHKALDESKYVLIENEKLRSAANYKPPADFHFIATRAFFNVSSDLMESLFLSAGADDGIEKYSAVINSDGLVGIVTEVGPHWSRVLSIFNRLFRVPVILPNNNIEAIVAGSGPGISFEILSKDKRITKDDDVLTSGRCVYIPEGVRLGRFEKGKLRPSVNFKNVDYVVVITRNRRYGGDGQPADGTRGGT